MAQEVTWVNSLLLCGDMVPNCMLNIYDYIHRQTLLSSLIREASLYCKQQRIQTLMALEILRINDS